MKTIHKKYSLACIVLIAFSPCCKSTSVKDHGQQSEKRAISTSTQLTVVCSPEKPTVESGDTISMRAFALSPDSQSLQYSWSATAGKVLGRGEEVRWDFTGVIPGTYQAMVQVEDSMGRIATDSVEVILRLPLAKRDYLRETGRSLLLRDKAEEKGYGLYSYLLFGSPPSDASRERYRKAIGAYLELIPDITILGKYIPLDKLNITYLPVDSSPEEVISIDWVLEHYDYARARILLSAIPGNHRNGPYILSSLEPLTGKTKVTGKYLYQDLSAVPGDRNLIRLWVKEFLNQAAQERFWKKNKAEIFTLKLRTTIAILAKGLPDVRNALDDWITWIN